MDYRDLITIEAEKRNGMTLISGRGESGCVEVNVLSVLKMVADAQA